MQLFSYLVIQRFSYQTLVLAIQSELIKLQMMDLSHDRRIYVSAKRRPIQKNALPDIKYSPLPHHKIREDMLFSQPTANSRLLYNHTPLSNLLVSKRITPPTPIIIVSKKRALPHPILHNFRIFKESIMKLTTEKEAPDNPEEKNKPTSLSHSQLNEQYTENIYTEQISLIQPKVIRNPKKEQLTFVVVKGNNNQDLVRELMLERKRWREAKPGQVPNFKWTFSKDQRYYKKNAGRSKLRITNHFEFSEQITTKDHLIRNLQIYCETNRFEVFSLTPITFIIDFDDEYCQYNLKQFLSFFQRNDPRKTPPKRGQWFSVINKMQGYMSWQNPDIKKKVNLLSKPLNNSTYYCENSYLWLLKPTGLNRGRGIEIFDSLDQMEKILLDYMMLMKRKNIKDKSEGHLKEWEKKADRQAKEEEDHNQTVEGQINERILSNQVSQELVSQVKFSAAQKFQLNSCSFVLQKYVQKPFLIHSRKFDIRVWCLLTDSLHLYFFSEGYIRTAAQLFSTDDISNYFIHLTNNAIQKYSQNYGQFQNGNQLSFRELAQFLPQNEVDTIWSRIKEITYMTFSSVKKKINYNNSRPCFEIFGLDFIIDAERKVWLIEVNENPCIECASPLLGELIPRMLNDAFKLTLDRLFEGRQEHKPHPVKGYPDDTNLWTSLGELTPNGHYHLRQ